MVRKINRVQLPIEEFGREVYQLLDNPEACQRWLRTFHDALIYRVTGVNSFAEALLAEADQFCEKQQARIRAYWDSKKNAETAAPEKKPARPAQPKPQPKPQPKKSFYGEFANVALSDEESAKLQAKLGPARFERGVEVLGAWKVNNPAKAARIKSDYACFTSWVIKRLDEEKAADAKSPKAFAASERDRMADIVRNEFPDVIEEFGL